MSLSDLPLVAGSDVLGHVHLFKNDRLNFLRSAEEAGPLSRVRFFLNWIVLANSPETAHEVLVERAASFERAPASRLVLHDLVGDGLFTSEGELWRRQRRLMSPLFRANQLAAYTARMNEMACRSLGRMRDGDAVDLAAEMTRITMGIVAATLFGADNYDEADGLAHALTVALKWIDDCLGSPRLGLQLALQSAVEAVSPHVPEMFGAIRQQIEEAIREPFLLPRRRDPEITNAIRTLDARITSMIDDRRENPTDRADLLTRLLLARDTEGGSHGEGMTNKQLRDEANTLFSAGHETTANALAWTFYLLARNPAVRARVQAEADTFGPEGPTAFEPERLAVTIRVFKEALRLFPPVVVLTRRSLEPVTIAGQHLPERTVVLVNVYGLHFRRTTWPEPDSFDPDRFTPEAESRRHKSAWLPFGIGPRVCIGNQFALMEGPIVLATLMRNARFEIDPDRTIEADASATLRPKGGIPAVVRR